MSRKHKFSNGSFLVKSLEIGASVFLNKHNHSLKEPDTVRSVKNSFTEGVSFIFERLFRTVTQDWLLVI